MNLLEEINKCHEIIKLHKLHQGGWKITPKVKTSQICVLLSCRWKSGKLPWCVAPQSSTRSAPLSQLLRHFPASKWGKSRLVGKVWMSTFQPKWNFSIWCPFAPPKLKSPKTASCVSKKWQKVIFCMFFDLLRAQNLMKCLGNCWASVICHEKSKNAEFLRNGLAHLQGSARRATRWGQKPVFWPKKFKKDQNCSKFSEIWAEGVSFSAMLLQGSLSQNMKGIGPFSPF